MLDAESSDVHAEGSARVWVSGLPIAMSEATWYSGSPRLRGPDTGTPGRLPPAAADAERTR